MQPTTIQSATLRISIVLAATVGIATSAAAQPQLAYAYKPHNDYIVFFDKDTNTLTTSAARTVRMAAREAGSGHVIKLAGNPGRTSAVKAELVREGIPAAQIEERHVAASRLPKAGDVASNPVDRRVDISF